MAVGYRFEFIEGGNAEFEIQGEVVVYNFGTGLIELPQIVSPLAYDFEEHRGLINLGSSWGNQLQAFYNIPVTALASTPILTFAAQGPAAPNFVEKSTTLQSVVHTCRFDIIADNIAIQPKAAVNITLNEWRIWLNLNRQVADVASTLKATPI